MDNREGPRELEHNGAQRREDGVIGGQEIVSDQGSGWCLF